MKTEIHDIFKIREDSKLIRKLFKYLKIIIIKCSKFKEKDIISNWECP